MSGDTIFREYRISDSERSDRSAGDRLRHRQKVRESIRENISDIIAEESIIGKNKDKIIKVPLRGIKEYRFIYGENAPGVGQGDGNAQPGQVVGKTGKDGQGQGDGKAGDRPGVDYYETDVTLDELIEIMFEDLELPNLERRALREIETDVREESNAAVICMMDTSGSMDTMKKYLARSFFFLLYQFISTRYRNVEIVFIAHHTEASEVTEEEFFHKGESGGTFISSGYAKALEIIAARYHPSLWNVYAFHCSDGDNFDSDNPAALKDAEELATICNLFGYGEIKPLGSRYYESSMLNVFRRIQAPNFHTVLIERKEDIWPSFKAFLAKDRVKEA